MERIVVQKLVRKGLGREVGVRVLAISKYCNICSAGQRSARIGRYFDSSTPRAAQSSVPRYPSTHYSCSATWIETPKSIGRSRRGGVVSNDDTVGLEVKVGHISLMHKLNTF